MTDRLTVNPGMRYEQQKLVGTLVDDFSAQEQLGAARRRDLRRARQRPLEAVCELRQVLRPHSNDLAARALSGDDGVSRARLLRRRPDAADCQRRRDADLGDRGVITQHLQVAGAGADVIDPNTKLS